VAELPGGVIGAGRRPDQQVRITQVRQPGVERPLSSLQGGLQSLRCFHRVLPSEVSLRYTGATPAIVGTPAPAASPIPSQTSSVPLILTPSLVFSPQEAPMSEPLRCVSPGAVVTGWDFSTGAVKCLAFDLEGRTLSEVRLPTDLWTEGGVSELNLMQLE